MTEGHGCAGSPNPLAYSDSLSSPFTPAGLAHLWDIIDSLIMRTDVSGPPWHFAS